MRLRTNQIAIISIILMVSLLSLRPPLSFADQQQTGTISVTASGKATPIGGGKGQPASLDLSGKVQSQGGGNLTLSGLTGTLQIASNNYQLSNGNGQANQDGSINVQATASLGANSSDLVLQGTMQWDNVTFQSKGSKLASQYSLALSGKIIIANNVAPINDQNQIGTSSTSSPNSVGASQNATSSTTSFSSSSSQLVLANVSENATVTKTEAVTITVANVTITQTVTSTVANITITVTTTSASNSTSTNSTQTATG